MNTARREQLAGEEAFLRARLDALPASAWLTRNSMESRLHQVEDALQHMPTLARIPARARLNFNGKPVVNTHGIAAQFGTKALAAFVEAVSAVAVSNNATLASHGPIPNRDQNQLLITGTARGSFGFELEEKSTDELPLEDRSAVAQALQRTQNLLESSTQSDDALADAAQGLDRRALDKVHAFVSTLAEDDAVCSLDFGGRMFRFTDTEQVRHSQAQLSTDNLHEEEQTRTGHFEGVLPSRRRFEFCTTDGELLTGRIAETIDEPHAINAHIAEDMDIKVLMTRAGEGRPRYLLLSLPEGLD